MGYQQALEQTIGVPFTEGNSVTVLKNGDEIFPSMIEAVSKAQRSISFLTFVYWQGNIAVEFAELFSRKAREDSSLIASDGLHPSGNMYEMWVDKVYDHVFNNLSSR